jgi:hypothetical protein
MSGDPSGIAATEVAAWLELRDEADPERRRLFVEAVSAMDAAFLKWAAGRRKERSDRAD